MKAKIFSLLRFLRVLFPSLLATSAVAQPAAQDSPAWQAARSLGRGVTLSWLEHYWRGTASFSPADFPRRQADLRLMQELGFTVVRLPVTFSLWADTVAPFTLNPAIFEPVDMLLDEAARLGLTVILDYHHDQGRLERDPAGETARIEGIWIQLAARYASRPPQGLLFELYNESTIDTATWQSVADTLVRRVRALAPAHTLVVGGNGYNSVEGLTRLSPLADSNLLYTFHFYSPFRFTHQGAEWMGGLTKETGISFPSDSAQIATVHAALQQAKDWSSQHNVPVYCGEFGAYRPFAPDNGSRCRYYETVRTHLESLSVPYTYWEWNDGFSLFDGLGTAAENILPCMAKAMNFKVP